MSDPADSDPPPPGSAKAVARGCTCPVMDNAGGRGAYGDGERYGWWMSTDCPLHGDDEHRGCHG